MMKSNLISGCTRGTLRATKHAECAVWHGKGQSGGKLTETENVTNSKAAISMLRDFFSSF